MPIAVFLITFLSFFCNFSWAQQNQNPFASIMATHGKGAIPPTAAQIAEALRTHPLIYDVELNSLGFKRVNDYLLKNKRPLLSEDVIAPKGQEIKSTIGKNTTLKSSAALSANVVLPDEVDNSTLPWFPPIGDQGQLGSCLAFSVTYYQLSYDVARINNWNITAIVNSNNSFSPADLTKVFSPKWTYNMINFGGSGEVGVTPPAELFESNGAPTWAQFPYDGVDDTTWPEAMSINTVTIASGGKGYSPGDILSVVQNGASAGTITVTSVNNGIVTGINVTSQGQGYSVASGLATTGGIAPLPCVAMMLAKGFWFCWAQEKLQKKDKNVIKKTAIGM